MVELPDPPLPSIVPTHTLVVAEFDPMATASLWLTRSAVLAAARIPTGYFWAMRFNLPGSDETDAPDGLCAVSSLPSPIPIQNASYTLGPKLSLDTGEISYETECGDVQLNVDPPMDCESDTLHQPLYLHTTPTFRVLGGRRLPIKTVVHELDADSFNIFHRAVERNDELLDDLWVRQKKARLANLLPHRACADDDHSQWSLLSGHLDPTEIFGERNNPHAYCFEFVYDRNVVLCDGPAHIYDEMLLYAQLCKEFRWSTVEQVIKWLRVLRRLIRFTQWHDRVKGHTYDAHPKTPEVQPHGPRPSGAATPTHAYAQALLQNDIDFKARFEAVASLGSTPYHIVGDSDSDDADNSGQEGYLEFFRLPFASPVISSWFTTVPLPKCPSVVVLDMFGVILDREGAIRRAIEPWLVFTNPPLDPYDAADQYIEYEALAIREQIGSGRATSLPAGAHTALTSFADRIRIPVPMRPRFIRNVLSAILRPPIFDDVEAACLELLKRGSAIVALVPSSASTLAVLRRAIPNHLLKRIHFYPVEIPVHTPVPVTFFTPLVEWCKGLPGLRTDAAALTAADVLVVSAGVGRLLVAATGMFAKPHPTALLRRPDGIEGMVRFYVGKGRNSPTPTVMVPGLANLIRALFENPDSGSGS
ncbi:hypothetical protein C8Q77DRAFT_1272995 [Trametes polyzona]|nr:hypothetical protein C8Q77DRAFT_1272995 [Trametes polyzona]